MLYNGDKVTFGGGTMTPKECQCTNLDCNLVVGLDDEITQELKNANWVILAEGCLGGPPDGYKLIRRNTTYNIYSSDIKSDIEGALETVEILSDPETMEAFRRGVIALEEGDFISLEQLERELGIE